MIILKGQFKVCGLSTETKKDGTPKFNVLLVQGADALTVQTDFPLFDNLSSMKDYDCDLAYHTYGTSVWLTLDKAILYDKSSK